MASPLAVGDCIAIIGVLTKFYNALSGSSDDAKELNRLVDDLGYMKDVLSKMSKPSSPHMPDPAAESDTLNEAVDRCKEALSEFAMATKKYAPTDSRVTRYYRRMTWSLWGKKEIEPFHRRIQSLTTVLGVTHAEANR